MGRAWRACVLFIIPSPNFVSHAAIGDALRNHLAVRAGLTFVVPPAFTPQRPGASEKVQCPCLFPVGCCARKKQRKADFDANR